MNYLILVAGSCVILFGVLLVGFIVEPPAWALGVVMFALLFPFAIWVTYREAKSSTERLGREEDEPT